MVLLFRGSWVAAGDDLHPPTATPQQPAGTNHVWGVALRYDHTHSQVHQQVSSQQGKYCTPASILTAR